MAHSVKAEAIVVPVNGADRYLYKGAVLPDGVAADDVKRLKSIGLVEEVKVQSRPRARAAGTGDPDAEAAAKAAAEAKAKEEADAKTAAEAKAAKK